MGFTEFILFSVVAVLVVFGALFWSVRRTFLIFRTKQLRRSDSIWLQLWVMLCAAIPPALFFFGGSILLAIWWMVRLAKPLEATF